MKRTPIPRLPRALGALAGGCVGSSPDFDDRVVQTAVVVDPVDFLGNVRCGAFPGAAQSYIATLVDIESGERIGPAAATSCTRPLAFHAIELDRRYGA